MATKVIQILKRIESQLTQNKLPQYLTLKDIKTKTTLSDSTIRRAVRLGSLRPINKTGKKLFRPSDVIEWVESR